MTALDTTGHCLKFGAVPNQPEPLREWLRSLPPPREVAVEACSFWPAFQSAIEAEVSAIRLVHPQRVKAIAAAKLKNDRVDSATLAHLLRCDLLPEAWRADLETRERRQRVRLRISLGQHRAALKNQVHAILHQQGQRTTVSDVFGKKGQQWLEQVKVSPAAREALDIYGELISEITRHMGGQERRLRALARADQRAKWLATIPGIGPLACLLQGLCLEHESYPWRHACFHHI